jgi:hypothetical protein
MNQEAKSDQDIFDYEGNEVKVGTKVRYYDHSADNPADVGTVIEITDWDGDVDDDTGRSIVNPPTVKVKYDDLPEPIEYHTSEWEFDYGADEEGYPAHVEYAKGKVEELMVVKDS